MTTFTIDTENAISAFTTAAEAAAASSTPFDTFTSQQEFAELTKTWPAERLAATWNSLPGVVALKSLPHRKAAKDLWAKRIWARIQEFGRSRPARAPSDASRGSIREA